MLGLGAVKDEGADDEDLTESVLEVGRFERSGDGTGEREAGERTDGMGVRLAAEGVVCTDETVVVEELADTVDHCFDSAVLPAEERPSSES